MCNMIFNEGIFYKTTSLTLDLASSFAFTCALPSLFSPLWAGFCADRRGFSPLTSTFCFCYCVWLEQLKKFLGSQSLISSPGQGEVLTAVPSFSSQFDFPGKATQEWEKKGSQGSVYCVRHPFPVANGGCEVPQKPDLEMGMWTTRPSSCVNVASCSCWLGARATLSHHHCCLRLPRWEFRRSTTACRKGWGKAQDRHRSLTPAAGHLSLALALHLVQGDKLTLALTFPSHSHLFLSVLSPSVDSVWSKQTLPTLTSFDTEKHH